MDRWSHTSIQVGDATYGTRIGDPPAGCVFRSENGGLGYAVLHIFGGWRGYGPDGLLAVDGVLYGVTTWGGTEYRGRADGRSVGYGVLYRLNLDGCGFRVLHNFTRAEGPSPRGTLAYVGGMLYGTTSETLFRIRPDGARFAIVHNFTTTDGPGPFAGGVSLGGGLLASNGLLYGVTDSGGDDRQGTVFRFDTVSGRFETLHAFKGPEGSRPHGALVLRDGMLYGVTTAGGRADAGVLFQLPVAGGPLKTLFEFEDARARVSPRARMEEGFERAASW
jgi:uncharacterized repeat protein (TIGR03803 family)